MSDIKHYNKRRHRQWAEKVLKRAGYLCEECRRYGRTDAQGNPVAAVVAHHKLPLKEYPEKAYDVTNGEALCLKCHNKRHPEKGGNRGRF